MQTLGRLRTYLCAAIFFALPVAQVEAALNPAPKNVVVLVDVSRSIAMADRQQTYRESFANALAALRPGDRLVVGPIGAKDRSTWLAVFDAVSPVGSGFRIADERAAADFGRRARAAFDVLMAQGEKSPDNATRIADAVEASAEALADPRRAKVLLILSDMEESGQKPGKPRPAPPALEGASIHVAGAGGGERYTTYERAWRAYFGSVPRTELSYGRFPARLTSK